jgi:branched-chain amino acid transport system substrate-binding protein
VLALSVVVAAACDGPDDAAPTSTVRQIDIVPPTTAVVREPDGILQIGLLVPRSGDGAEIGQSLDDAVNRAVDAINAAGGFGGSTIELVEADEGANATTARQAIQGLIEGGVDAVIGPTSSLVALGTLGDLMAADVLTCSPTASAQALDDYPDRELFFRTVPSDSLQAAAIAQLAEQTGARTARVVHLDDVYGRPLAEATMAALEASGLTVSELPFSASQESFTATATQLLQGDPGVIVVIADADAGIQLLSAIGEVAGETVPDIVINGAMRRPSSPQLIESLPAIVREQIEGVGLIAFQPEGAFTGPYATNAEDCVNLIALAAAQAGVDDPDAMAAEIPEVSRGGVACGDYADCLELLTANRNFDYDGKGGAVQLGMEGDPQVGRFQVFTFDRTGLDHTNGRILTISP